jgi:DNA-directed RNA polymerase specialized sigma subunit
MIETLQNLYDDLGRIPLAPDIQAQTKYSQHDFTSEFGSLDDALAEAGYDKRKELLNEIKRVADELGRPPTTVDFAENAEFSSALYARYFGTWEETLEAVGVNKEENDESDGTDKKESGTSTSRSASSEPQANGSEKRTAQDSPSNEELLEELRTLDERLETVPRWGDMNERGAYNSQTYINRFESWDDALEEAGVDKGRQLLTELRRVADEVGRTPLRSDMNEQGRYSVSMYAKFFGSWVNAVNQLDGEEASSNQQNETPTETSQIPEKDALISELNRLSNETDGLLKATDLQDGGAYEVYQYTEQFGSWDEALDEAGIDRNTQLLTEVEQVWEQLGRRPSTGEMNEYGGVSATTVTKYFDSWESACNLADPNIDSTGGFNFGTNYDEVSNQELLKAIEQLHIQIGDSVTPADVVSFTEYDEEAYRAAFGSVIEAMREAGLDV